MSRSGWILGAFAFGLVFGPGSARLRAEDPKGHALPPRALLRIGTDDLRMTGFLTAIAFSPDGRLIAAGDGNAPSPRVAIFDVRTGRRIKRLVAPGREMGSVQCVSFSPDGTRLFWGESVGRLASWDTAADRLLFREKVHRGQITDIAFSPDGSLLASAGGDGIHLRRVARPGEVIRELTARAGPVPRQPVVEKAAGAAPGDHDFVGLAFTPDGTRLIAGSQSTAMISLWRVSDGRLLRQIGPTAGTRLNGVAVTPDGRRILSAGFREVPSAETKAVTRFRNIGLGEVRLWDIETGQCVADYLGDEDYGFFATGAPSPDGRLVAVIASRRLHILDSASGRRAVDLPGLWGHEPVFSPDGALVATTDHNSVAIIEVTTGRRLHDDVNRPAGHLTSAAWSPTGDRIVTGHADGYVRVWNVATGKLSWHRLLAPLVDPSGWPAYPAFVDFSRDGRLVVAAGRRDDPVGGLDGIVAIYEADSGKAVREVPENQIRWASLAPDARIAVVATSYGAYGDTHFLGVEVDTGRTRWANPPVDQRRGLYPVAGLQFEGKSLWYLAAFRGGQVIRFNALTGHEQRRFLADWRTPEQQKAKRPSEPDMWEATFSPDGRTLVSCQMEWIYVWDVESGTLRRKFRHPHQHGCNLTLAPDGRTLATSDLRYAGDLGEDTIRLFDIETGEQVLTLDPGDDRANVMVFSPDGKRLFTGFHRGSGIVWDVGRSVARK